MLMENKMYGKAAIPLNTGWIQRVPSARPRGRGVRVSVGDFKTALNSSDYTNHPSFRTLHGRGHRVGLSQRIRVHSLLKGISGQLKNAVARAATARAGARAVLRAPKGDAGGSGRAPRREFNEILLATFEVFMAKSRGEGCRLHVKPLSPVMMNIRGEKRGCEPSENNPKGVPGATEGATSRRYFFES
ncbi:hypothetical protein EVAR_101060_1 [Eumeta japonica]|uniref:Uncharacterized protein n=1 Tax=Eumeta variegata TaxID=151549 RepID=A0A4C2AAE7_EUMVA|nr:hypothetical protein EVAR_101060_1 [Eumeta japonica]